MKKLFFHPWTEGGRAMTSLLASDPPQDALYHLYFTFFVTSNSLTKIKRNSIAKLRVLKTLHGSENHMEGLEAAPADGGRVNPPLLDFRTIDSVLDPLEYLPINPGVNYLRGTTPPVHRIYQLSDELKTTLVN